MCFPLYPPRSSNCTPFQYKVAEILSDQCHYPENIQLLDRAPPSQHAYLWSSYELNWLLLQGDTLLNTLEHLLTNQKTTQYAENHEWCHFSHCPLYLHFIIGNFHGVIYISSILFCLISLIFHKRLRFVLCALHPKVIQWSLFTNSLNFNKVLK